MAVVLCGLFIGVNTVFSQGLTFTTNTISLGGSLSSHIVVADVNGDGKMDLVTECNLQQVGGTELVVLTNNGSGGFGIIDAVPISTYTGGAFAVADINGDGKQDVIGGGSSTGGGGPRGGGGVVLIVATNNGGNGFISQIITYRNPGAPLSNPARANIDSVLAADINGDGKPDLIIANDTMPGYLTILTNGGTNFFSVQTNYIVGNNPRCVVAADVNRDGYLDLICANAGDNTLMVLTNDGSGIFGSNATLNVGGGPYFIAAADIDGDGSMDLISANSYTNIHVAFGFGNTLTILTNDGSGVFGSNATLIAGTEPTGIIAADINGDGYVDLVNANYYDNTLTIFTNNGSGVFGSNVTLNVGPGPFGVVTADFNGDGKLDLATANGGPPATLTVLTQTRFSPPVLNITSSSSNSVVTWLLPVYEPSPSFTLQTNSDLTTTNWGLADYVISSNGSKESFTVNPLPSGNLFFRLMAQ